ncbi:hypothetical protein [Leptotrichia hongkongensis]|uniref:hypothetical protein n=1 Tax=Leptotrichia hongkongensis TaxID=554406 RepID=UPI0035A9205A
MRKIIFIFVVFSLVSFSKSSEVIILKLGETFSSCDKKRRNHLDELKDEWEKMNEIYNKLIQKFDKNNKLKQNLINSQKIWIKKLSESKNYTGGVFFPDLCLREKAQTIREINLIQQRILELTNEYKKYLD